MISSDLRCKYNEELHPSYPNKILNDEKSSINYRNGTALLFAFNDLRLFKNSRKFISRDMLKRYKILEKGKIKVMKFWI